MTDTPNTHDMLPNSSGGDDPNLTAYALGELQPGSDVYEQIKARLETDADAKAFVEQTRALGQQLSASYQSEETHASGLSDHQQKELAAMIDQQDNKTTEPIKPAKSFWRSRPALLAAGLALAAGAAITTVTLMNPGDTPTTEHVDTVNVTGLDKVGEGLAANVAVDFENAPLAEVFAFLNKQTSVAIDTDWDALAKRGITSQTPVTLQTDELVPAGRVLTAALQAAWSQSPHPDPAQWTMSEAGVTIAPQSSLVQARLEATAKLLETDRLSRSVIDQRVLSADTAQVWESDLWNKVMAQRGVAADAVLAEADAAFDAADQATAEDDYDRAARQTMYAYYLLRANNTLLTADQFDAPNERFDALNKKIAEHQRQEDEAALAEALKASKAEIAKLDEKMLQARTSAATEKFKQAEQAQQNGQLHAAVSLYEDAVLLSPENGTYQEKLSASKEALQAHAGNYWGLNDRDRSVRLTELSEVEDSLGRVQKKLEKAKVALSPNTPAPSSVTAPAIVNKPGANFAPPITGEAFGAGYAGKQNSNAAYQQSTQHYFALGVPGQGQGISNSIDLSGQARGKAGLGPSDFKDQPEFKRSNVARYAEREALRAERDFAVRGIDGRLANGEFADDIDGDFFAPPVNRPQRDAEGKTITRRAQLEGRLERLVDEKPLPQLDERTQAQYKSISIALEDAKALEKLELKRLEEIGDLEELVEEFNRGCVGVFDIDPEMSRDAFALVNDNPFYDPADPGRAQSTFSVDVDTAAYTIARRQLMERNQLPVPGAVRIEEMINYFDYNYDAPVVDPGALEDGVVTQASLEAYEKKHDGFAPFATHIQVTDCPWTEGNQLVRIGIKGMEIAQEDRPAAHLTFLLDVSGSMNRPNKLGLVKDSLKLLLDKLNDKDHISIVVYAGASGIVLENAPATNRAAIEDALDKLRAGGSTAGAAGIQLAYQTAQKHYIDGGVNRVILCTDGDFNVGTSNTSELVELIKQKANPEADADGKRRGVYLSAFGYGMGNLNDAMMEPLTNAGNGNYAYIDTLREATKVMYDQAGANLVTIAKDVKIQVQFDPDQVMAYRLIGYENRVLANEDFDNDKVDAGDIGAGHSVTALYEIVPFLDGDGGLGNEGFFEVRHRIDELEQAVTLNQTLMQTASLNQKQSMKLAASTRMLEQEIMLAGALLEKLEDEEQAEEAEPVVGEAPAVIDDEGEADAPPAEVEPLKNGEMLSVKLRYKPVDAPAEDGTSRLIETSVFADDLIGFGVADESTRFAAAVASFAMQLRSSPHAGDVDLDWVLDTVKSSSTHDPSQLKAELQDIIKKAKSLMPEKPAEAEAAGAVGLR